MLQCCGGQHGSSAMNEIFMLLILTQGMLRRRDACLRICPTCIAADHGDRLKLASMTSLTAAMYASLNSILRARDFIGCLGMPRQAVMALYPSAGLFTSGKSPLYTWLRMSRFSAKVDYIGRMITVKGREGVHNNVSPIGKAGLLRC